MRILITGATGNVGRAVIQALQSSCADLVAGVRNCQRAQQQLGSDISCAELDFSEGIFPAGPWDAVFLLRPPQLAKVEPFEHFLHTLADRTRVVFLSVQGAEHKHYLPHAKIEKAILERGLAHTFLRPGYFMENLTTTLWPELEAHRRIFLPSADLALDWVAVDDVAAVAARCLLAELQADAYTLVSERKGFAEVIQLLNRTFNLALNYESPGLLPFVWYGLRQGYSVTYLLVMLLLHYLPRFSGLPPPAAVTLEQLLTRPAITLDTFVLANGARFSNLK